MPMPMQTVFRTVLCLLVLAASGVETVDGQQASPYPPELQAVLDHVMNVEYLELFDSTAYRLRVENVLIEDFDGDGGKDVLLHMNPHYRQSPTLVFFQVDTSGTAARVREGLAPGPLRPVSGEHLDPHGTRRAADVVPGAPQEEWEEVIALGLEQGMHLVRYKQFLHMDMREGSGGFIDMSDRDGYDDAQNCGGFEFSPVRQVVFGTVKDAPAANPRLVALLDEEIYVYEIAAFTQAGRIELQKEVLPRPDGLISLGTAEDGSVVYQSAAGGTVPLRISDG